MSQQKISPVASAVAGALASSVSLAITYPLTTLTTRQQVDSTDQATSAQELYAGIQPAVYSTFISQGTYFYYYQLFSDWGRGLGINTSNKLANLAIATLSGSVNVLLTNPLWVLVVRLQTDAGQQGRSTMSALREVLAEKEGIKGLWKGVMPSLMLVSNPAIMFVVFESLLARAKKSLPKGAPVPSSWIFLIGALAKLVATVLTFPLLAVKSRMQAKQKEGAATSVGAVVREIVAERGWVALYSGIHAKILQTVLNTALMFTLRDKMTPMAVALTSPLATVARHK